MTTSKRRRHPRVPEFPPLEELQPGAPFNPFRLFVSGSVIRTIARFPKLGAGQKLVWLVLADQCLRSDYDWHSHRELAEICGISPRQFRRHLARLRKLKLVHVAADLGKSDHTWLLYHSAFAFCTPLTQVTSDLGGRSEVSYGVGQKRPTHGLNMDSTWTSDGATRLKATSGGRALPPNGRRVGEDSPARESTARDFREQVDRLQNPPPDERTENTPSGDAEPGESLVVVKDARAFWYSLEPTAKRNRFEQAARVHDRIQHFRNYLKDPHAEIARQAEHEISRALDELRRLGFTLHTNGKGTR